jgi:hypothetical protein
VAHSALSACRFPEYAPKGSSTDPAGGLTGITDFRNGKKPEESAYRIKSIDSMAHLRINRLTESQIEVNRQEYIDLLRSTGREGVEDLIAKLTRGRFFTKAPLLTQHHRWKGGLVDHLLGVLPQGKRNQRGNPARGQRHHCIAAP